MPETKRTYFTKLLSRNRRMNIQNVKSSDGEWDHVRSAIRAKNRQDHRRKNAASAKSIANATNRFVTAPIDWSTSLQNATDTSPAMPTRRARMPKYFPR